MNIDEPKVLLMLFLKFMKLPNSKIDQIYQEVIN